MQLFWEVVGSLARWGLSMLSLYLVRHHVLTTDQTERVTDALVTHIVMYGPAFAALVWAVINKWWKNRKRTQAAAAAAVRPPPYASLGAH